MGIGEKWKDFGNEKEWQRRRGIQKEGEGICEEGMGEKGIGEIRGNWRGEGRKNILNGIKEFKGTE